MTIINIRNLSGSLTGVQRYTLEMVAHFPQIQPIGKDMPVGFRGHIWEQVKLPTISSGKMLWSPANTGPIFLKNQIITIHDVASLDHPEWFAKNFRVWYSLMLPQVAKSAEKIITVSEFSKMRIIENLKVDEDKVFVTPLASSGKFRTFEPGDLNKIESHGLHFKNYFLIVASLEPRKNIKRIIEAWKLWEKRPENIKLVIVGGASNIFTDEILENSNGVLYLGRVSDDMLISLYACALGFIYVPLYEGFGLPPLEAMSAGLPVISSNTTSLPEVTGEAAILVNPLKKGEIFEAILSLASDNNLRNELSKKSLTRSKLFSWKKTAKLTAGIIGELIK